MGHRASCTQKWLKTNQGFTHIFLHQHEHTHTDLLCSILTAAPDVDQPAAENSPYLLQFVWRPAAVELQLEPKDSEPQTEQRCQNVRCVLSQRFRPPSLWCGFSCLTQPIRFSVFFPVRHFLPSGFITCTELIQHSPDPFITTWSDCRENFLTVCSRTLWHLFSSWQVLLLFCPPSVLVSIYFFLLYLFAFSSFIFHCETLSDIWSKKVFT